MGDEIPKRASDTLLLLIMMTCRLPATGPSTPIKETRAVVQFPNIYPRQKCTHLSLCVSSSQSQSVESSWGPEILLAISQLDEPRKKKSHSPTISARPVFYLSYTPILVSIPESSFFLSPCAVSSILPKRHSSLPNINALLDTRATQNSLLVLLLKRHPRNCRGWI